MKSLSPHLELEAHSFVQCGPGHRIASFLGLDSSHLSRRMLKVLMLLLLTWFPLLALSLVTGRALPGNVTIPFLHDIEANGRLLLALPLLELALATVGVSLAVQAQSFLDMELISEDQQSRFAEFKSAGARLRNSNVVEGLIFVLATLLAIVVRGYFGRDASISSWERVGGKLTVGGWWNMLVSIPILYFLLLRWLWVLVLWSKFLFQVSRLDLQLTATHPDRVGGLGFLAWGVAAFAPLTMAVSFVAATGLADAMFHYGFVLNDLKDDVLGFVIIMLMIVYAPLLPFLPALLRCRYLGLLAFAKLVLRHDRLFDEKWLQGKSTHEELLGSSDIQSLADAGTAYEHIVEMWFFPFDIKAFALLALATLLPFSALLPLQEILIKFGEILI